MKYIEQLTHNHKTLICFVESDDKDKAYVSYFIDGIEITDFSKLLSIYQKLFDVLRSSIVAENNLQLWSF